MRRFAGLICIAAALGCTPPVSESTMPVKPAGGMAPTSGTTSSTGIQDSSAKLVSMNVEDMHCPISCYPKVKKVLESMNGVDSVELAKQKVDGEIDNPVVFIKLNGAFDSKAAIAALDQSGFTGKMSK